jgi:hypothetical protein
MFLFKAFCLRGFRGGMEKPGSQNDDSATSFDATPLDILSIDGLYGTAFPINSVHVACFGESEVHGESRAQGLRRMCASS